MVLLQEIQRIVSVAVRYLERGYHLHFMVLDGEDFHIKPGAYQDKYGPYQIPYGYTYNPLNFFQ